MSQSPEWFTAANKTLGLLAQASAALTEASAVAPAGPAMVEISKLEQQVRALLLRMGRSVSLAAQEASRAREGGQS